MQREGVRSGDRGVGGQVMDGDRVPVGIYWDPQLWDLARAAFVSDLLHDQDPPPAFIAWLHRALEHYAQLEPAGRSALGIDPPQPRGRGQGQGKSRMSPLNTRVLELVDQGVADDLRELGKMGSRSAFIHEAVTLAVQHARARNPEGELPPPPARLNTNPHRRRPLRRRALEHREDAR